jgi:hypothetical protein
MLGLVVMAFRGVGESAGAEKPRRAFGAMALAMAIAVSPICVYVLSNLLRHHQTLGIVSSAVHIMSGRKAGLASLADDVPYIWQFYLPRLPGMVSYFPGISTIRQVWFDRAVGLYGWVDTSFPVWVYNLALIPAGLLLLLGLRTLIAFRVRVRARVSEIVVYVTMGVGLMALTAQDSHLEQRVEAGWAQPRYLLPLLPLVGAMLVLAARGGGRRWGPVLGALIVALVLAQSVFSQLLVVSRFYG